jgi:hypothetical protein
MDNKPGNRYSFHPLVLLKERDRMEAWDWLLAVASAHYKHAFGGGSGGDCCHVAPGKVPGKRRGENP